jgi:hypothetical protein
MARAIVYSSVLLLLAGSALAQPSTLGEVDEIVGDLDAKIDALRTNAATNRPNRDIGLTELISVPFSYDGFAVEPDAPACRAAFGHNPSGVITDAAAIPGFVTCFASSLRTARLRSWGELDRTKVPKAMRDRVAKLSRTSRIAVAQSQEGAALWKIVAVHRAPSGTLSIDAMLIGKQSPPPMKLVDITSGQPAAVRAEIVRLMIFIRKMLVIAKSHHGDCAAVMSEVGNLWRQSPDIAAAAQVVGKAQIPAVTEKLAELEQAIREQTMSCSDEQKRTLSLLQQGRGEGLVR